MVSRIRGRAEKGFKGEGWWSNFGVRVNEDVSGKFRSCDSSFSCLN